MVDAEGRRVEREVPPNAGPASLLVSEVSDAVKKVRGDRVVGSIHRGRLWSVEAFVLNRIVLARLDCGPVDAEALLEAVAATGFAWQAVPVSG